MDPDSHSKEIDPDSHSKEIVPDTSKGSFASSTSRSQSRSRSRSHSRHSKRASRAHQRAGILLSSIFHLGTLFTAMMFSLVCSVVGGIFLYQCPGNRILPFLLLCRVLLAATELLALLMCAARDYEWARRLFKPSWMGALCLIDTSLFVVVLFWFTTFAMWVVTQNVNTTDPTRRDYCHPFCYAFSKAVVYTIITLLAASITVIFAGFLLLAVSRILLEWMEIRYDPS